MKIIKLIQYSIFIFICLTSCLPKAKVKLKDKEQANWTIGIDVSHYQGEINWNMVPIDDIEFVYMKVSEGDHKIDSKFLYNWSEVQRLKIPAGGYHFFVPTIDPELQAKFFLQTLKSNKDSISMLPPVIDVEILDNIQINKIVKNVIKWIKIVEQETSCKPIIYTNYYLWANYFATHFNNQRIWIAAYNPNFKFPLDSNSYLFWQYKQNAIVPGIRDLVSKNKFRGTLKELSELVCHSDFVKL